MRPWNPWNPKGGGAPLTRRRVRPNRTTSGARRVAMDWRGPRKGRTRRTRSLIAIKRVVLWTFLGCLGLWAGSVVHHKVDAMVSTIGDIRQVRVSGNVQVTQEEVISRLALTPRDTLLSVDPDRLEARLETHPWIHTASIARVPLHTIDVTVRERRVAAVLNDAGRSLLLDAEGSVLEVLPRHEHARSAGYNLPVLKGLSADRLLEGEHHARHRASTGLRLAALIHETAGAWPEVDLSLPHMMVASLAGNRFQFGTTFEEQWHNFQQLAAQIPYPNGDGRHDIDLRYDGKIIVRERG